MDNISIIIVECVWPVCMYVCMYICMYMYVLAYTCIMYNSTRRAWCLLPALACRQGEGPSPLASVATLTPSPPLASTAPLPQRCAGTPPTTGTLCVKYSTQGFISFSSAHFQEHFPLQSQCSRRITKTIRDLWYLEHVYTGGHLHQYSLSWRSWHWPWLVPFLFRTLVDLVLSRKW